MAIAFATSLSAGSIEGWITNSVTGDPVDRVRVRLLDRQGHAYQTASDSNGEYRFADLKDGDYTGEFSRYGFSADEGKPVHLSGDAAAQNNVSLQPWGGLRGRVEDEDGKPAANVKVEISQDLDNETNTDEHGEFAFKDLAPGPYTVVAKPEPKMGMKDGVQVSAVPIYYPSALELTEALPITVRNGVDASGIAIRLRSVPVYRVSGVVLDPAGKPVAKASVKLMGRPGRTRQWLGGRGPTVRIDGPEAAPELALVESREDGGFEFPAVRQGIWRVSAETEVAGDLILVGVSSANVSDEDLEDIKIRLSAPFGVDIGVDFGGAKDPGFAQRPSDVIALGPLDGQPRLDRTDLGKINGIFPGRYLVMKRVVGPFNFGWRVAAILLGGRDVMGQVVELTPGASLQAIYKQGGGTLRGTAGEGATVFLVPHEGGEVVVYSQASCSTDGVFDFGRIDPGDYYVVAFDRTDGRGLPSGNLPASIIPFASSVRVQDGSQASVEVRVNKWPW